MLHSTKNTQCFILTFFCKYWSHFQWILALSNIALYLIKYILHCSQLKTILRLFWLVMGMTYLCKAILSYFVVNKSLFLDFLYLCEGKCNVTRNICNCTESCMETKSCCTDYLQTCQGEQKNWNLKVFSNFISKFRWALLGRRKVCQ